MLGNSLFNLTLYAQTLTNTFMKLDSLNSLTYKMISKEKDLFSDKIFHDTLKVSFPVLNKEKSFQISGTKVHEIYDGKKLIQMDLDKLTYQLKSGNENSLFQYKVLPYLVSSLKKTVQENSPGKSESDTVISGKKYVSIQIKEFDSLRNGKRVYRIIKIVLDKGTYLPFHYRSEQQGFIDGTDMFVDTYLDIHFYDYQLNQDYSDLSSFVVPDKFSIEKPKESKPILKESITAPELLLKDSKGFAYKLENQKGKVILLNFSSNSCPHSIESIKMLNTLNSTYGHKNFIIVTINPHDDKEAIEKYNHKGNIKYPIFTSEGSYNLDNYNVDSFPTFYLIDKYNKIIKGFRGYHKSLDDELNELIKKHI
jgi:thiol-disulfide isomerase/thioredoxin